MPIRPLFTAVLGMLAASIALVYGRAAWAATILLISAVVCAAALMTSIFAKGRLRQIAVSVLVCALGCALMAAVFWRADTRIRAEEARFVGEPQRSFSSMKWAKM